LKLANGGKCPRHGVARRARAWIETSCLVFFGVFFGSRAARARGLKLLVARASRPGFSVSRAARARGLKHLVAVLVVDQHLSRAARARGLKR